MSKPKALVTRPLFPAARAILDQHFDAEYWTPAERIPRAELLKRVADKDALVCLLTEKVDEELLALAPKLRVAATVSVGYDNIDVPACTRHKVLATHTPGVLDETTADFAWTLLMAIAPAAGRRRRVDALGHMARMGPRSASRRRRLGEDAGHRRLRTHRPRPGAPCAGLSDARALSRRDSRGARRRKGIARGVCRLRPAARRIRFHFAACPAASGNAPSDFDRGVWRR